MERLRRAVRPWLMMAAVWSGAVLALLLVEHQVLRLQADDPQLQLAQDAATRLAGGASAAAVLPPGDVDIGHSLAPFLAVYDASGAVLASNGRLHGAAPTLPGGVLEFALAHGGHRLSWQPEAGVRHALVVVPVRTGSAGFVVAGRSLREVEARKLQVLHLLALAWGAGLAALALLALACPDPRDGVRS